MVASYYQAGFLTPQLMLPLLLINILWRLLNLCYKSVVLMALIAHTCCMYTIKIYHVAIAIRLKFLKTWSYF